MNLALKVQCGSSALLWLKKNPYSLVPHSSAGVRNHKHAWRRFAGLKYVECACGVWLTAFSHCCKTPPEYSGLMLHTNLFLFALHFCSAAGLSNSQTLWNQELSMRFWLLYLQIRMTSSCLALAACCFPAQTDGWRISGWCVSMTSIPSLPAFCRIWCVGEGMRPRRPSGRVAESKGSYVQH